MSANVKEPMTLEAFLDWERRQDIRYEFDGSWSAGDDRRHDRAFRLPRTSSRRWTSAARRAMPGVSGRREIIVNGRVRYPDTVVTCSPVSNDADVVPEPVVVFEVLSRSTAGVDRIVKHAEYEATPSIRRYVMLEDAAIAATVFSRDRTEWRGRLARADAVLAFPELAIEVPLREFYEGLDIPAEMLEEEP